MCIIILFLIYKSIKGVKGSQNVRGSSIFFQRKVGMLWLVILTINTKRGRFSRS
jgi:hypothetical protein